MRNLNRLLSEWLCGDEKITSELVSFGGVPAIVNTEFPSDQEEGWDGKTQFPRISYRVDRQADYKRSTSGMLRIAIYTLSMQVDASERIENAIRDRLSNVVMHPDDSPAFCVSWRQTTPYEIDRRGMLVLMKEVAFDILEYPAQVTVSPDPALSLCMFLKRIAPEAFLVSYDHQDGVYEPTDSNPAVYVRLSSLGKLEETYALLLCTCQLELHVLAPTAEGRLLWVRALYDELFKQGEIPTEDGHPLKIREINANIGADYLTSGQLTLRCTFYMLSARVRPEGTELLNHPYFDGKDLGG